MRPHVRQEDLVVRRVDDEVLVYDLITDKAHALNGVAGLVFDLCDGTRDVEAIAQVVEERLEVPAAAAQGMADLALEQLAHRGLLQEAVERATGPRRLSRRQLMQQLAAAAVAIPVIVSLSAPWPAAAQTLGEPPAALIGCGNPGECRNSAGGCCSGRAIENPTACPGQMQCTS